MDAYGIPPYRTAGVEEDGRVSEALNQLLTVDLAMLEDHGLTPIRRRSRRGASDKWAKTLGARRRYEIRKRCRQGRNGKDRCAASLHWGDDGNRCPIALAPWF